jgi:hypothetical protein
MGIVLIAALLFVPIDGSRVGLILMSALLYAAMAACGLAIIRAMVYQKFRYAAYFGQDSITTLTDEGVRVSVLSRENLTAWPKYKSAVRYADGIMLLRNGVIWWLPDLSLATGAPQDVVLFVGKRMLVRSVA